MAIAQEIFESDGTVSSTLQPRHLLAEMPDGNHVAAWFFVGPSQCVIAQNGRTARQTLPDIRVNDGPDAPPVTVTENKAIPGAPPGAPGKQGAKRHKGVDRRPESEQQAPQEELTGARLAKHSEREVREHVGISLVEHDTGDTSIFGIVDDGVEVLAIVLMSDGLWNVDEWQAMALQAVPKLEIKAARQVRRESSNLLQCHSGRR